MQTCVTECNTTSRHSSVHQHKPSTAGCARGLQRCRHIILAQSSRFSQSWHTPEACSMQQLRAVVVCHEQGQQLQHGSSYVQQMPQLVASCSLQNLRRSRARHNDRIRCASNAAGSQPLPDPQQPYQGVQQQQQQHVQGELNQGSRPASPTVVPHFMHMQPPPQPVSVPPMLSWMPPQLLLHLRSLSNFLQACWALLPEFVSPNIPEALRRLVLVLGASLALIVVVSTIDSGWLYLYLLNARRVPVAA